MFSKALFMFSPSLKFSRAANLFVISVWYTFLNSNSFNYLRLNLYQQTSMFLVHLLPNFHKFCNYPISIIISSPTNSHILYTRLPSHFYQYVISLVVSLCIRTNLVVLMNLSVWEHCVLTTRYFDVAQFIILTPLSLLSWSRR
jgi:hypothetical protein